MRKDRFFEGQLAEMFYPGRLSQFYTASKTFATILGNSRGFKQISATITPIKHVSKMRGLRKKLYGFFDCKGNCPYSHNTDTSNVYWEIIHDLI